MLDVLATFLLIVLHCQGQTEGDQTKTVTDQAFEPVKASHFDYRVIESVETNLRNMSKISRTLKKAVTSVWQDEGVGARVRRSVGRPEVSHLSLVNLFILFY